LAIFRRSNSVLNWSFCDFQAPVNWEFAGAHTRQGGLQPTDHRLLIAFCKELPPIAQAQRNLRSGHGVDIAATRSAVVAGGQRAADGQRRSLRDSVAGILGPLAQRLGEAPGRLRLVPENLGEICEVVFQVISKGSKLPVNARRIEAEEARESGRRPWIA
jgi:hypothetical protein